MNISVPLASAILIGLGATLTLDLWTLIITRTFNMTPSSYCMVGRWILYMPEGILRHSNITHSPQKNGECTAGLIAHYMIGIVFAIAFITVMGNDWLQHPVPIPAIIFGVVTVSMPFFIMQPCLGLGFAASRAPNPAQARFRSLVNHTAFGIGLYIFGLLVSGFILR